MLRATGLTKRYGELLAVDSLSFEVRRGEIFALLGPNGAGKTTTLKMLCGLARPDAGTIELKGRIGLAPQQIVIWELLTCREQLQFVAQIHGLEARAARARADHLLAVLGLVEKAGRLGKTLSGGMQRRLNIALGLVHGPELLLLDEPQAGLDPQSRVLVRDYLRSLRGELTVILTTHDMEEAEKLADRVCIVDHGKLLALDTVEQIKMQHGERELFELETSADDATLQRLLAQHGACSVQGSTILLEMGSGTDALARVLAELSREGLHVRRVRTREVTLEDVFLRLTGRRLRE